jgi:hypothetical protein
MNLRTYLVIPDMHVPFHDKAAFNTVLRAARALKPYGLINLGDMADMMSVSTHPKTPADMRWQLEDEVAEVIKVRRQLDALGCKDKRITLGNHETRGQRLAQKHAMGLFDSLDPDRLFGFTKAGWKVYGYQQHVRIGKINYVHDVGFSGANTAAQNARVFQTSVVGGHCHNTTIVYSGNADHVNHVSATLGWLGDPAYAQYMADAKKRASWTHSFGVVYYEPSGVGHLQVVPIIRGRCVVQGHLF